MFSSRTRDTVPQATVLLAVVVAVWLLLTRIAHADPVATSPIAGINWTFWIAVVGAVLGGLSAVLHLVATKTHSVRLAALAADVDLLRGLLPNSKPATDAPALAIAPRNTQAGSTTVDNLVAIGLVGLVIGGAVFVGCTATQAKQGAAAGTIAALDCEAAHLDAVVLADVRVLADAEVQRWIGGAAPADLAALKARVLADLTPIKSDLGRCAIAAAIAAVTAAVVPAPGVAVAALTGGPDPALARTAFALAARQLGWPAVRLAGGAVL